jgi:hypothetical protein
LAGRAAAEMPGQARSTATIAFVRDTIMSESMENGYNPGGCGRRMHEGYDREQKQANCKVFFEHNFMKKSQQLSCKRSSQREYVSNFCFKVGRLLGKQY